MLAAIPIGYSTPLTLIDTSLKIAKGSIGDARVLKPVRTKNLQNFFRLSNLNLI
jgi:hypothetical protein